MNGRLTFRTAGCATRQDSGQAMVEFMLVDLFLAHLVRQHAADDSAACMPITRSPMPPKKECATQIVHGTGNSQLQRAGYVLGPPAVACPTRTGSNVKTVVTNFASVVLSKRYGEQRDSGLQPEQRQRCACNVPGCLVRVTVSYTYQPFFGLGWPSSRLTPPLTAEL